MTAITFDTLAYFKKMKEAGFTDKQAEMQAEGLAEILDEKLATKSDIVALQKDVVSLKEEFKEMRTEMKWLFGMTIAFLTFVMTASKFFH
jgi:hypothetical protein